MTGLARRDGMILGLGLVLLASSVLLANWIAAYVGGKITVLELTQGVVYAAAVWLLLNRGDGETPRWLLPAILVIAVLMRLLLLVGPQDSTDIFRYIWDGRVQAAGINPYRYIPADAALERLRDPVIYAGINRAEYAPTIYPPMAQLVFLAVTRVSESVFAMKLAMLLFEAGAIAAMLALLKRRGLPLTRILIYAWHPLPIAEFAGSGHVDAAAIALMMVAILLAERKRPALGGALLAAATLVKFFPAVIAPALWRRWDWRAPAAFVAVIILLYLPYLGVGERVLGFLPGYVSEEGLAAGDGFFPILLLSKIAPMPAYASKLYLALAALVLIGLGLRAAFREHRDRIDIGMATILVAAFLLILSPHHAWYFTWLIPFLLFRPSPALVWLTCAAPFTSGLDWEIPSFISEAALYVPFAALCIFGLRDRANPFMEIFNGYGARPDKIG